MGNRQNSETFDPKNVKSITKFANGLTECRPSELNDRKLFINMMKAINALKQIRERDYKAKRTRKLLKLVVNISLHCKTKQIMDEFIREGIHLTFKELIESQINKEEPNYYLIDTSYMTLMNLTFNSIDIANENKKNGFFKLAVDLFHDHLKRKNDWVNDEELFGLYGHLVTFILYNAKYREMRNCLVENCVVECLSSELNKLKILENNESEIRYVILDITMILAYLLNDNQLDTMAVSNDVVDRLVSALNECIKNSKINSLPRGNTKYYNEYSIAYSDCYQLASNYIACLQIIAVNDTIKQKLFDKSVMSIIEEFLNKGNQVEIKDCTNLLCTLCFNQNVIDYLRSRQDLQNLIKIIKQRTEDENIKDSCNQIEAMLGNGSKRSAPSVLQPSNPNRHIMISYNHKCKTKCLRINDELVRRGYRTWMDVKETFNDLYDAIAEAIENASIVLVCYSDGYKMSSPCRLEARRAFELRKEMIAVKVEDGYQADGWLGLILAGRLYVDFSNDIDSPATYDNLFRQIDSLLNEPNPN